MLFLGAEIISVLGVENSLNKGMCRAVKKWCLSAQAVLCPLFRIFYLGLVSITIPFIGNRKYLAWLLLFLKYYDQKIQKRAGVRKSPVLFFARIHCSQRSLPCRMTPKPALAYPEQAFFWARFYR